MPRAKTPLPTFEEQLITFVQSAPLAQVKSTVTTAGVLVKLRERNETPTEQPNMSNDSVALPIPRRPRKALGKGLGSAQAAAATAATEPVELPEAGAVPQE